MNVALSPELEHWVKSKVKSGLYKSPGEVIQEAVRMLYGYEEQERLRQQHWLRQQLAIGINQLEQGQSQPLDAEFVASVKKRGRHRLSHIQV